MVKVLLETGGQVDVPNSIGHTPLFYLDDVPAMKQLLAHGADLNVRLYRIQTCDEFYFVWKL